MWGRSRKFTRQTGKIDYEKNSNDEDNKESNKEPQQKPGCDKS